MLLGVCLHCSSLTSGRDSGIAGGVNPDNHIGDVVVAAQWAHHLHQKMIRTMVLPNNVSVDEYYDNLVDFPDKFYGGSIPLVTSCKVLFLIPSATRVTVLAFTAVQSISAVQNGTV